MAIHYGPQMAEQGGEEKSEMWALLRQLQTCKQLSCFEDKPSYLYSYIQIIFFNTSCNYVLFSLSYFFVIQRL